MRWLVIGGILIGTAASMAACGDTASVEPASDAGSGSETSTPIDDASVPFSDGGDDAGGEEITDGGSNFDPDAGDDGGLPDGGSCNAIVNDAQPVVSTCISLLPKLNGGALVAGTYHLTGVAALGTATFCQTQFVPTGFKETVEMTVAGGVGTLQSVVEIAGFPPRHRTSTLAPGPGDTSPAKGQPTCPTLGAEGNLAYASRLSPGGKQVVVALLPYGKGLAIYRFEKK